MRQENAARPVARLAKSISALEKEKMTLAISEKILKRILADIRVGLEPEKTDDLSASDALQRRWMSEGLNVLEGRIDTWAAHQRNIQKLRQSRLTRLVTKNVTLSRGRYRKFEWYEGKRFIALAFRWGTEQPEPEIGLQIQDVNTLRNKFLVYQGALSYDDLVELAKRKGIRGIRNSNTTNEWRVEQ